MTIATMPAQAVRERMRAEMFQAAPKFLRASGRRLRHYRKSRTLPLSAAALFDHLDHHASLAGHMERPSAMMGGGHMTYSFDEGRGATVGSRITMSGTAFGLKLSVEEEVTVRDPPHVKIWRTVGNTKLLIIGAYEMGFRLAPASEGTRLTVWIDYALPGPWLRRLLGQIFASLYARWCVRRMVADAANAFPLPL